MAAIRFFQEYIVFITFCLLIASAVAWPIISRKKIAGYFKNFRPAAFLIEIPQFLFILYCSLVISLSAATLIFGYLLIYCGRNIPVLFIMLAFVNVIVFALRASKMDERLKAITGPKVKEKDKACRELLYFNLILVLATAGLAAAANITGKIACETAVKDVSKKGLPVSFREFVTPVPAGRNAAFEMEKLNEKFSKANEKENRLDSQFTENDRPDRHYTNKWTTAQRAAMKKFLKNNAYLAEFKALLRDTDYYRYTNYENVTVSPMSMPIPRFADIIELTRQISAEIKLAVLEGRQSDALALNSIIAKTCSYMSSERTLIAKMITIACLKMGANNVYTMTNTRGFSAEKALASAAQFEPFITRNLVREGMEAELVLGIEFYRWMFREIGKSAFPFTNAGAYSFSDFTGLGAGGMSFVVPSGMLYAGFPVDFRGKAALCLQDFSYLETVNSEKFSVWPLWMAIISMPKFNVMYDKQEEARFAVKGIRILKAAKDFYAQKGVFPRSPADLLSYGLAPDEIIDPLSEKKEPVKFKQTPGGLVIYSIGSNKTDDNGDIGYGIQTANDTGFVVWK